MSDDNTYEWEFPDGEYNSKYTAQADKEGLKIRCGWLEEIIPWEWFDHVRPTEDKKRLLDECNYAIGQYKALHADTEKSLKSFIEGESYYRQRSVKAKHLIELAIEMMTPEQISQWKGVRAWLEGQPAEQCNAVDLLPARSNRETPCQ